MSTADIRIGKTLDEAIKFAFGNLGAIVRIGWFPTALMIGLMAFIAWTFWQPVVIAYFEFLQDYMAAATDADELVREERERFWAVRSASRAGVLDARQAAQRDHR